MFIVCLYYTAIQDTHFTNTLHQVKQPDEIPATIPTSPHSPTEEYHVNVATHSCRHPTHISATSRKSYQLLL